MKDFEDTIAVNLPTILEKVKKIYSKQHVLIFNTCGISGIEDHGTPDCTIERTFKDLGELYLWCMKEEEL